MMDLLERYLADVRRNLPAREADDIVAELRDLLLARAEEQEEKIGSVDWTALLRDFGHPLVIAARYRKQQWLIGPELYPFYVHFLKMIVGIVLVVVICISAIKVALWASDPGPAITGLLGSVWGALAGTVGSVTILFVIIERFAKGSAAKCTHWKPSELPEVLDKQPTVYESAFEVGLGALMLLWWVGIIPTPPLWAGEFRLEAAPVWAALHSPVAALLAGRLAYVLVRWLRPRWKAVRGLLGATTAVGALIIAGLVYRAGQWVTVVPTGMTPDQAAGLQGSLDLAFRIAIVAAVVIWTLGILGELWKLTRGWRDGRVTA
jgi:hypothetical protein